MKMRWKKWLCWGMLLLILLSATGCEKQPVFDTDPAFNPETDHQHHHMDVNMTRVAETETGYYYLTGHGAGFLHYVEKSTMQDIVLCYKPNCTVHDGGEHSDEELRTCGAYFQTAWGHLLYYKGYLYCLEKEISFDGSFSYEYILTRVSLDGTERKPIWKLDVEEAINTSSISDYFLHRGVFYFQINRTIYAYSLDSKRVKELQTFDQSEYFQWMCGKGDFVFLEYYDKENIRKCFRYTVSTDTWDEIEPVQLWENGLYRSVWDSETRELHLTILDLYGQEQKTILLPNRYVSGISEKYIFAREADRMMLDGKEVTMKELENLPEEDGYRVQWILPETYDIYDIETLELLGSVPYVNIGFPIFEEDRIMFFETPGGEEKIYYADIADLGTENLQWQTSQPVN